MLYIFLWALAAIAAIILLLLIALSISAGFRISNSSGKNKTIARYGIFRLKIMTGKKPTEKQKAKKQRKAQKKAQRKKQKEAKKKEKGPVSSPPKKPKEILRTIFTTLTDGKIEYLKLFYVKKLYVYYSVGGADYADIGRKYGRMCEIVGIAFPVLKRVLRIKRHRVIIMPDIIGKKTNLVYDIVILVRPIKIVIAALEFFKASQKSKDNQVKQEIKMSGKQKMHKI